MKVALSVFGKMRESQDAQVNEIKNSAMWLSRSMADVMRKWIFP